MLKVGTKSDILKILLGCIWKYERNFYVYLSVQEEAPLRQEYVSFLTCSFSELLKIAIYMAL